MFHFQKKYQSTARWSRRRSLRPALAFRILAAALLIASLYGAAAPRLALAQAEPPAPATDCDRAAASDFDKQSPIPGIAFNQIDPKAAIPACLDALAKNPDSARLNFELGRAYDADGNFAEALKYFLKAAASHFALAEVNLGTLYFNGQGVEKDYAEAARLLRLAAIQGFPPAQNRLGALYAHGQGVERDEAEATKWYAAAAAQGYAPAQASLEALKEIGRASCRERV